MAIARIGGCVVSDKLSDEAKAAMLSSLGVRTTAEGNLWARILLLGPAKLGKTTAVMSTAPDPLHINCDGESALKESIRQLKGKVPLNLPCYTRKQARAARKAAPELVKAGLVRTVVFDSITLFADKMHRELVSSELEGYDLFRELGKLTSDMTDMLFGLEAHVFIIGHLGAKEDFEPGVLPAVSGQTKLKVPAAVDDWVIFDFEAGRKPHERMFLLGPQKGWNAGGRNFKRTTAVPATVPALFEEMGLPL